MADDETGFTVERLRTNDTTSSWTTIATLPADSVQFLDTGVFPGDSYKYRVTATNTTAGITSVVQTDGTPITASSVTVSISGDSSYVDNDDGTRDYTLILTSDRRPSHRLRHHQHQLGRRHQPDHQWHPRRWRPAYLRRPKLPYDLHGSCPRILHLRRRNL